MKNAAAVKMIVGIARNRGGTNPYITNQWSVRKRRCHEQLFT